MSIRINDILSSRVAGELNKHGEVLGRTYERLSSGLRITRASDDTAGLAISAILNARSRTLAQAARNISDAVSFFSIADSALTQLSAIVQRQGELAQEAANGTFSVAQRRALSKEANALVDEYNRIVQVTQFNGVTPLGSNGSIISIQASDTSAGNLAFSVGGEIDRTVGVGTRSSEVVSSMGVANYVMADFNGDGKLDVATAEVGGPSRVRLGNGNGTFGGIVASLTDVSSSGMAAGDLTGDGIVDLVTTNAATAFIYRGNGSGSFTQIGSVSGANLYPYLADQNSDGRMELLLSNATTQQVHFFNADGSYTAGALRTVSTQGGGTGLFADFNNDGIADYLTGGAGIWDRLIFTSGSTSAGLGATSIVSMNDYGTLASLIAADFNFDGNLDIWTSGSISTNSQILLGRGDGTFAVSQSFTITSYGTAVGGDVNGDGLSDITFATSGDLRVALGNGDGTFKSLIQSTASTALSQFLKLNDVNGDGVPEFTGSFSAASQVGVVFQNTRQISTMPYLNLTTASGARAAMPVIEATRTRIALEQSVVGAQLSRLEAAAGVTGSKISEYTAANTRITDADIAHESAQLARVQILQQTTAALLAQANQNPQIALDLIRGA